MVHAYFQFTSRIKFWQWNNGEKTALTFRRKYHVSNILFSVKYSTVWWWMPLNYTDIPWYFLTTEKAHCKKCEKAKDENREMTKQKERLEDENEDLTREVERLESLLNIHLQDGKQEQKTTPGYLFWHFSLIRLAQYKFSLFNTNLVSLTYDTFCTHLKIARSVHFGCKCCPQVIPLNSGLQGRNAVMMAVCMCRHV